ncbi:hypothetical protein B6259_06745 [Ruminococcaceae bacterium CPB6]|jgi:hypothetical protein|nr:hypothetical protein B6259_06745 [Ruminococcaceae bacterium CPB6]
MVVPSFLPEKPAAPQGVPFFLYIIHRKMQLVKHSPVLPGVIGQIFPIGITQLFTVFSGQ